jgi:hypothetical protein
MAIAKVVMRRGQELAGLDEHFADMLVAVVLRSQHRQLMQIEDVHGAATFQKSTL